VLRWVDELEVLEIVRLEDQGELGENWRLKIWMRRCIKGDGGRSLLLV